MKINWEQTTGNHWQAQRGTDENGNRFIISANREIVTVKTKDGFNGVGWTPEEALSSALADRESKPNSMTEVDKNRLAQLRAWGYEILTQDESDEFEELEALERGAIKITAPPS